MLAKPYQWFVLAIAGAVVLSAGALWITGWSGLSISGRGRGTAGADSEWTPLSGIVADGVSGSWTLVDAAQDVGIDFVHTNGFTGHYKYQESIGAGVAMFDYDGDGWLDIYFVNGNRIGDAADSSITNILFRNNGNGGFEDVTSAVGVGDPGYGQGCCAGDFDNDGDLDLYVTNVGPDVLYRNDGGRFVNITGPAGIDNPHFGQCCAFFDYDNDGWLDLYVQNYVGIDLANERPGLEYVSPRTLPGCADQLYRNNHDGTFTEVGQAAGIARPDGRGMGLVCADMDADGDVDVFVANDGMENYFFVNNGDGTFAENGLGMGVAYDVDGHTEASMGADVGDYDGDGELDIVCPALWDQGCTLYKNRAGAFGDVSHWCGLAANTRETTGFSPNFLDVDNDGDLDLFLCNGGVKQKLDRMSNVTYEQQYGRRDQLLINNGMGGFDPPLVSPGPHFERALIGRGSAAGDIDNDGDIDVVVNNLSGKASVLRNDSPQGNWLTLDLVMRSGHRGAIGTKVHIIAGDKQQVTIVRATGGYCSLNDRRPHFGIGAATRITSLTIQWPDGTKQQMQDIEPNRFLRVQQND